MADAIVLVAQENPEKPLLYACPKCGAVNSPKIYMAGEEERHKAARRAAENCYNCITHYNCDTCGCETPKGWGRCSDCRRAALLEKAEEIPDNGGPYCEFNGDTYYHEMEYAQDDGLEWVSPCHVTYPSIDQDSVIDMALDGMFDDASPDDLNGLGELLDAINAFNKAQNTPTFYGDNKRKIRVPSPPVSDQPGVNP